MPVMKVYFDNAATTAVSPEVLDAMLPFLKENYGNPSSIHSFGRIAKTAIENARKTVAGLLNASTGEIFFTSCGTESNNMVLRQSIHDLQIKHVITSRIEHHCVWHTLLELKAKGLVQLHYVNLEPNGHIDYNHLQELLHSIQGPKMVSLMFVNNEIGNLLDMERVSALCGENNAYFHSDTVQGIGTYPIDVQELSIDFLSGSAHKFHGPKGIGFLYIKNGIKLSPLLTGGAQERNMRSGTENVAGIVGLTTAFKNSIENLDANRKHILGLKNKMVKDLRTAFPGIIFNGDIEGNSHYKIINASFPLTSRSELLLFNLDIEGICVSGGSACSSGTNIGSHVLEALDVDQSLPAIRFSFSKYNTREEVDVVIKALKKLF
jgi:cysteine desulfurase